MRPLFLVLFFISPFAGQAQHYDFTDNNFAEADSVALNTPGELEELDTLVNRLTSPFNSDVDKYRAIYRWVTENIMYDIDLYFKSEKKQAKLRYNRKKLKEWNAKYARQTHRRLMKKQLAVCSGYAYMIEAMCQKARIPCVTISGHGRTSASRINKGRINHAWNAVQLNNKWYLCDATWSNGYYNPLLKKYVKQFDEGYFLTDPDYFIADHYPKEKRWTLILKPPTLSEFLSSPIKLKGFFENQIVRFEPKRGIVSGRAGFTRTFRFTANQPVEGDVVCYMVSKKLSYETKGKVTQDSDGYYRFDLGFYSPGTYKVYIEINSLLTLQMEGYIRH